MDWKPFNSVPVLPRDRVDTKSAPEAKPTAPKGDAHGEKFARSLSETSPRANAPAKPAAPARKPELAERPQMSPSTPVPDQSQAPQEKVQTTAEGTPQVTTPAVGKKTSVEESSPVRLPKELEGLLKTAAPEAGQETLSLIANILLQAGPIQENVPVLGVLTGDFSHIAPQDVPAVILKSPFIGKALASDAIGDFLDKKITIGDLLTSLSVDRPTIDELAKNGVNLNQQVSPRTLLKAVGIDTQVVQDELHELRGALQVEGLKSLMERAKKRASESPESLAMAATVPQQVLSKAIEIPVPMNSEKTSVGAPLTNAQMPTSAPAPMGLMPNDPFLPKDALLAQPLAAENDAMPQARLVASSPYEALGEKMSGLASSKPTTSQSTAAIAPSQPIVARVAPASDKPATKENDIANVTPLEFAPQTKVTTAPSAGITVLGQVLDAKAGKEISAPDTAQAAELPSEPTNFMAPPADKAVAPARMLSTEELIARLQKPEARPVSVAPIMVDAIPTSEPQERSSEKREEQPADDFAREMDSPLMQRNETFGFENVKKQNFAAELLEVASPIQPAEVRETIHNRIFDQATMMLSEGGGSMRLDLGSKDMGVLDLAVNVQNDQLDLRIIASSENVREILTQDIPRLKDALTQQNLQLRNVEIAVGQSASWAGQSGSGFQDSRQHAPREEKLGEIGRASSFTSRARSYIPNARSVLNAHAGRIQVLV